MRRKGEKGEYCKSREEVRTQSGESAEKDNSRKCERAVRGGGFRKYELREGQANRSVQTCRS